MDGPPRIEELLARAVDDEVAERRSWREAVEALGVRIAALEGEVGALRADLANLAGRVEAAPRTALDAAAGELGRRVDELGRLVVRDLGRLKKLLDEQRAAVLAEVRATLAAEFRAAVASPPPRPAPVAGPDAAPPRNRGDSATSTVAESPQFVGEPAGGDAPRWGMRRRRG